MSESRNQSMVFGVPPGDVERAARREAVAPRLTSMALHVGVRDLHDNLSRYLREVEAGQDILVTSRGRLVARITGPHDPRSPSCGARGSWSSRSDRSAGLADGR